LTPRDPATDAMIAVHDYEKRMTNVQKQIEEFSKLAPKPNGIPMKPKVKGTLVDTYSDSNNPDGSS
jgi:hypothetical protein